MTRPLAATLRDLMGGPHGARKTLSYAAAQRHAATSDATRHTSGKDTGASVCMQSWFRSISLTDFQP